MDVFQLELLAFSFDPGAAPAVIGALALRIVKRLGMWCAALRTQVFKAIPWRRLPRGASAGAMTLPRCGTLSAERALRFRPSQANSRALASSSARSHPRVSVIMPVYNGQPYLQSAVESILRQTLTDFEFIIVDDGSTDGSKQTLEELEGLDPRIRLLERSHAGIVEALNLALEQARGEYIARMDQDDIALPERLRRQVEFLDRHADHVLVGSRVMLTDPDGAPICEFARESTHEEIDQAHLELRWAMVHPTIMVRRDAMRQLGGYRSKHQTLEDLDLFFRLAEIGKVANIPEVLLHYRRHHQSMCTVFRHEQNAIRQALHAETCARRGIASPIGNNPSRYRAPDFSNLDIHRQWSWRALEAGNVSTARKHSLIVARRRPFDAESWRLIWCSLRGF